MKKISSIWKDFKSSSLADTLNTYLGIFVMLFVLFLPVIYGLNYIDFLKPITEPVINIALYIGAFGVGAYLISVGCIVLWLLATNAKYFPAAFIDFISSETKIRKFIAWIAGISVSIPLMYFSFSLLNWLDIEFHENSDLALLSAWGTALILSVMIGARIGMAVFKKDLRGGMNDKTEMQFQAWFVGVFAFGTISALADLFTKYNFHSDGIMELIIIGAIFAVLKPWHDMRIAKLSDDTPITQDSLQARILINFSVGIVLLIGIGFFSVCVGGVFWVQDAVEKYFHSPLLSYIAAFFYAILVLGGTPFLWGVLERRLKS